jgi:RNA polymerase sigma-70 factor (ECF subfamily)
MDYNERITELFRNHADELARLCFLYLKDVQLAQDAVSETYLKAFRKLGGFKGRSTEKTWLTRIAINCCKNIMRSRAYRQVELETIADDSDACRGVDKRESVSREVMKLPFKYREAILLFYYRELTVAEIAKLLKLPRTTVDYRLRQARTILKSTLKECYFNE